MSVLPNGHSSPMTANRTNFKLIYRALYTHLLVPIFRATPMTFKSETFSLHFKVERKCRIKPKSRKLRKVQSLENLEGSKQYLCCATQPLKILRKIAVRSLHGVKAWNFRTSDAMHLHRHLNSFELSWSVEIPRFPYSS